jgi:formate dehydrogenase major subunit
VGGKFSRGKGLFSKTDYVPPAELPDAEYPLLLSTGRRLYHYHSGTQTRNSVGLEELFPEELLELSAEDAARLGIQSGDRIKATSRRGCVEMKAWITRRSPPGVCWTSFHFAESCGNALTIDRFDKVTETAEYKCCAIRVEKLASGSLKPGAIARQARP